MPSVCLGSRPVATALRPALATHTRLRLPTEARQQPHGPLGSLSAGMSLPLHKAGAAHVRSHGADPTEECRSQAEPTHAVRAASLGAISETIFLEMLLNLPFDYGHSCCSVDSKPVPPTAP